MPSSGPTQPQILDSARHDNPIGFRIVELTPEVLQILAAEPPPPMSFTQADAPAQEPGAIGVGDELSISVFEVGTSIFSGRAVTAGDSGVVQTGAVAQVLPRMLVDGRGMISIPYAGEIQAAGLAPGELARAIEDKLKRTSQKPQVIVQVVTNIADTVIVSGEVKMPGRHALTLAHETLLDMIALSGGPTHIAADTIVKLSGPGHTATLPLNRIEAGGPANPVLNPGDRIELIYHPRSFTSFGASGRINEVPFESANLTLAQALARAGGPSDYQADPKAIYLFRYESPEISARLGEPVTGVAAPVIYHIDLMKTASYFAVEQFAMRDHDLLYIANSRINSFQKLMGLVSGIFTPVLVGKTVSQ